MILCYDWATKGAAQAGAPGDVGNDGEQIWQKLVKKHQNSFMVISGHVYLDDLGVQDYATGLLESKTDHGNTVYQMVVNYQQRPMGGEALLRILEFLHDGQTIQIETYSPLNEEYLTEPDHQFVINRGCKLNCVNGHRIVNLLFERTHYGQTDTSGET
jgi:hypothetical protein